MRYAMLTLAGLLLTTSGCFPEIHEARLTVPPPAAVAAATP